MAVKGIDVSKWEDKVDYEKAKADGIQFVIIKASQGIAEDLSFQYHRDRARAAGLPIGFYHFYSPYTSPRTQADFFVNYVLENDLGDLPLFVDLELFDDGTYHGWSKWYGFLEYIKEYAPGKEIVIYTSNGYWNQWKPGSNNPESLNYFAQYPLWIAHYTTGLSPLIPTPWTDYLFWQYSESGWVDGVEDAGANRPTTVDLDWFNGDYAAFSERFDLSGVGEDPSPEPEPEPNMKDLTEYIYQANPYSNMSLREGHSVYDNRLATLQSYEIAYGDEIWVAPTDGDHVKTGDVWIHVLVIYDPNADVAIAVDYWMAITHLGYDYCLLVEQQPLNTVIITDGGVRYKNDDGVVFTNSESVILEEVL